MKIRSYLVILGVFAIGFFLGMLTSAQVRNKKMKEFRTYATPEAFSRMFEKAIEPTPEQMQKILPVLEMYAKKNHDLRREYQKKFFELMKQYRQELEPNLTREQIEKLSRKPWMDSYKRGRPGPDPERRKYRHGPGPADSLKRESYRPGPGDGPGREVQEAPADHHPYPIPGGEWI